MRCRFSVVTASCPTNLAFSTSVDKGLTSESCTNSFYFIFYVPVVAQDLDIETRSLEGNFSGLVVRG